MHMVYAAAFTIFITILAATACIMYVWNRMGK